MKILTLTAILFSSAIVFCQAGIHDSTFNEHMYDRFGNGMGMNLTATSILTFPDTTAIVSGSFGQVSGFYLNSIVKLRSDGSPDLSFNPNFSNAVIWCSAKESAGTLLFAGTFDAADGQAANDIVRLNPEGTLNATFSSGSGVPSGQYIKSIAIQADGKILIAGNFTSYNGQAFSGLARLNADGSIDTGFSPSNTISNVYTVTLTASNDILVGGTGSMQTLSSSGTLLSTYALANTNQVVKSIAIQADGKMLVGGDFTSVNGASAIDLIRLGTDGSQDAGFMTDPNFYGYVNNILVLNDGRILVGGQMALYLDSPVTNLVLLNTDGSVSIPAAYVSGNDNLSQEALFSAVQVDGKLLVAGSNDYNFQQVKSAVTRYKPDMTWDLSYQPFTGTNGNIDAMIVTHADKIYIGGDFTGYNNNASKSIARINAEGTFDTSFVVAQIANTPSYAGVHIYSLAVQTDDKLLVGGTFTSYDGQTAANIVRLNPDGSIDTSFHSGTGFDNFVKQIVVQPDGKILLCGPFENYNGLYTPYIIRLNSNGEKDLSFSPASATLGPLNETTGLSLQDDGKILFSGMFDNGTNMMRMLADGSEDQSFQSNYIAALGQSTVYFSKVASGKIYLEGAFENLPNKRLIRLNSDGTIDASFEMGEYTAGINCLVMQNDGKIVIGGTFSDYGGRSRMLRLNSDGTPDLNNSFGISTLINFMQAHALAFQSDGQLIVAGKTSVNVGSIDVKNGLMRLLNDVPGFSGVDLNFQSVNDLTCFYSGGATAAGYWGTPPYTYEWADGQGNPATFLHGGVYACTITDSQGATDTKSLLVSAYGAVDSVDLVADIVTDQFRIGFEGTMHLDGFNRGCIPSDGELKFMMDTLAQILSVDPAPASTSGDTLIWSFDSLVYGSGHLMPVIEFYTSADAAIGDTIEAWISINGGQDYDFSNNMRLYYFPVINGYDPNRISVYPSGICNPKFVSADKKLTYTIQFQNTGNAEAVNIKIVDSLGAFLNLNTVNVIDYSHNVWTEVQAGNVLKFHFDGIYLADSTINEQASHGYVTFEVLPNSTVSDYDLIANKAEIYFDFNPAIVTNSVSNTILHGNLDNYNCSLGLASVESEPIGVYPNPSTGKYTITASYLEGSQLVVSDIHGSVILKQSPTADSSEIDVTGLPTGVYLVSIAGHSQSSTTRVIKL